MRPVTLAAVVTTLALPASALAAPTNGVVLSVDAAHHTIQVVDSRHVVHAYHYRGRLSTVRTGTRISFQRAGQTITHVKATAGASRTVSFYGTVVHSSSHGLVLRLADGKTVSFSSKQLSHKRTKPAKHSLRVARAALGGITINIQGLQPGETVLVTETVDPSGNVTITITLPNQTTPPGPVEQQASGVLTTVDTDTFTLHTGDGSDLRLHMAQDALANLNLQTCETVNVTYHEDNGLLVADTVQSTGTSTTGDCAPSQDSQDDTGTILHVSATGLTIDTQDQGPLTFATGSPDITSGYQVGDVVDVTYTQNSDGTLDASDVQYVEQDATGTVTAVSDGSVTITDDSTGQPDTFTADPTQGVFAGVAVGDQVDVTYHQTASQLVADTVDDQSSGGSGGN